MSLKRIMLIPLAASLAASAHAQASADSVQQNRWGAHVDVEMKPGTKRHIGESNLFLPLAQDERTLWFADLRGRLDNQSNREGNLGLGVRRMLDGGWNFGGYGFFDRRRTESGNFFNQMTLGAELLGSDWDFRANAYAPQGDRVRELSSTTSGGTTSASLVGNTVQVITAAGVTTTREERALKGFDAEAGWRLPFFDAESSKQLRVYLGGYRFSDSAVNVSGSRARLEFVMANLNGFWQGGQLTLGAEAQHDHVRGGQTFLAARLRIPLGGSHTAGRTLNAQEQRMTAPVVRDVDIVTQVRSRSVMSTPQVIETTNTLANGQALTVLDSASTIGAALPGAVAAAGANSTVLLAGTFNTSAITALQPGQTLMGAGTLTVKTPSGRTASVTTPMATISGAIPGNAPTVNMASNSTLTGMKVSNVATGVGTPNPRAAQAIGVTGVTITNNHLMATGNDGGGTAIALLVAGGSSNIVASGNTLTALGPVGHSIGLDNVGATDLLFVNNTVSATSSNPAGSLAVFVNNGGSFRAGSTGNVRVNGICSVGAPGTGSVVFTDGTTCP